MPDLQRALIAAGFAVAIFGLTWLTRWLVAALKQRRSRRLELQLAIHAAMHSLTSSLSDSLDKLSREEIEKAIRESVPVGEDGEASFLGEPPRVSPESQAPRSLTAVDLKRALKEDRESALKEMLIWREEARREARRESRRQLAINIAMSTVSLVLGWLLSGLVHLR